MESSTTPVYSPRLPQLAKYDVLEEIGHGGMATVYRAHDARLSRDVAVKVLHAHLRDSEEVGLRFAAEAKAVAKLRHPNIVEVYDVSGDDDGERYLVVELVRGQNLRAILRRQKKLPAEVAAALAVEVLQALVHAHAHGVVHRDIKPENVMVEHVAPSGDPKAAPGDRCRVKLMDFGIAKLLDSVGVTSTGQVLGSPAHMAPEQIEGGNVDVRADVYAAGVMLYECLVGDLPFTGTNPAQVLRRVLDGTFEPVELAEPTAGKRFGALVSQALAHDPKDRLQNAAAFRDALSAELDRLGVASSSGQGFGGSSKVILEAYFDDPDGFEKRHRPFLLARLCELGKAEIEAGGVLAAAADYNRALALDPHNAELLRTVTRLRRGQARGALVKKSVGPAVVVVLLGLSAYGATRLVERTSVKYTLAPTPAIEHPRHDVAVASSAATSGVTPPPVLRPPPRPVKRALVFGAILPAEGVRVSIDGQSATPVGAGQRVEVDGSAHELRFGCMNDLCEVQTTSVAAGERDAVVTAALKIKPAQVFLTGDPLKHYQLGKYPGVRLQVGYSAKVPLTSGSDATYVVELETSQKRLVTLVAGREVRATFDAPAAP